MILFRNILKYKLGESFLSYFEQNKEIYYFLDNKCIEIGQVEVENCHWYFEDYKYLKMKDYGQVGYYVDYRNEKILNYKYTKIVNNIGVAYDYSESDGRTHKETLFLLPEEKPLLSSWLSNSIFHVQDQYWVNDTVEDFKLIDADKGEISWVIPQPQVDIPYGYTGRTHIKKVLGIYKDCLWLQLPDSRLWKIDLHTGMLLEELEHEYFCVHQETISFDVAKGAIIILGFDLYAYYDIDQKQIIKELILPDTVRVIKSHFLKDNKIAFICKTTACFASNVYGIFDIEKADIVFEGEMIESEGYFYELPQVNDELFTILDAKGNLIIHRLGDIL